MKKQKLGRPGFDTQGTQRPPLAAFDQGEKPTIAVVYKATVGMGVDVKAYIDAQQKALNQFFAPVWGTPATLVPAKDPVVGAWNLIFTDDADQAGALGYHELDQSGMPVSFAFVKTTLADGENVTVTASHELWEMLGDPAINLGAFGTVVVKTWLGMRQVDCWVALETADAVERESFDVDGIAISDFVFPSYFEGFRSAGSDKFDYLGKVHQPFQILPGGYLPVFINGQWSQTFGSKEAEHRHQRSDRRLHRSHRRKERHERQQLQRHLA